MFHLRVEQHQLVTLGVEGEVFEFARTTVEPHQLACLTEDAGKLVHDAALHAAVVVFRSLSGQHHVPLRDFVLTEEIVQRKGETAFQCGRRRHSRTQRNVACKGRVEAFDVYAQLLHLLNDAVDVACPTGVRAFRIVYFKFYPVF